jgi:hypothetical protein
VDPLYIQQQQALQSGQHGGVSGHGNDEAAKGKGHDGDH